MYAQEIRSEMLLSDSKGSSSTVRLVIWSNVIDLQVRYAAAKAILASSSLLFPSFLLLDSAQPGRRVPHAGCMPTTSTTAHRRRSINKKQKKSVIQHSAAALL
jgi:hypothetical protein